MFYLITLKNMIANINWYKFYWNKKELKEYLEKNPEDKENYYIINDDLTIKNNH